MRTWISPAPGGLGSGTSRNASTSGPPYASHTIAFMNAPLLVYARFADHLTPFRYVGFQDGAERLRCAAHRLGAGHQEPILHVAPLERLYDLAVQAVDDGRRRLCRREHARHRCDFETR